MTKYISIISICGAILLSAYSGYASPLSAGKTFAELADTVGHVAILFRFDSAQIDSTFMDNTKSLRALDGIMEDVAAMPGLDSITVTATSSPDGPPAYNRRLAQRRANSLRSFILERYSLPYDLPVGAYADGRYWEGLIDAVEADAAVPGRDQLLAMLRDETMSDEAKNQNMQTMLGGKTFAYLCESHILRRLRGGAVAIRFSVAESPVCEPEPAPVFVPEPEVVAEPVREEEPEIVAVIDTTPVEVQCPPEYIKFYPVALRTNMLLDIVGGANIGVEVPIGNHFSAGADFLYSYTRLNNRYALQAMQVSIEGRYWFNRRSNLLTGWNLGAYGAYCNRFDIQWGGGYQGDGYWSGGVSGGYSWRLSDSFNLDLSAMAGFVYMSEVRYYDPPQDGHLIWTQTRYNAVRFLPMQVRANLVWLIGAKKKISK